MNRVISLLKSLRLRQIITVFLVGLTVFVMQAFGYGNTLQAQADETVESPLGVYYKGEPGTSPSGTSGGSNIPNGNNLVDKAKQTVKETADNLKDTLSTDRNVRQNLKETADSVKETLSPDETVKSPLGVYYKGEPGTSNTSNIPNGNKLVENAKQTVKETADNARETLDKNVKTPEASHYNAASGTNATSGGGENLLEKIQESLKETAETVKEKLNLDEETPRATKEFLGETQERVEKAVEPITGERHGSFQQNR